jgi:GDPmannose 4,6-dehydratase
MWLMLQQDTPDDYVIATGVTHTIADLLDRAFRAVGIDDWAPYVRQDPKFMRPAEVDLLIGDATKARTQLGWTPKVDFDTLITMMVTNDLEYETRRSRDATSTRD